MVTGRDVANRAGTSTAVVSYVFNNGPRAVAPSTRARVLKAAEELNYRPNALARALSFGRTSSIGLVVPDIANRYFGELARALEDAASLKGDLLVIGDSGLDHERERSHIAAFADRRVDSVVMVSLDDDPDISPLRQANIPVVALQPVPPDAEVSTISIDYEQAAYSATVHLLGHGYTSVALFNTHAESTGAAQHRAGFERAMSGAGGVVATEWQSQISRSDASKVARQLLASDPRPRAVYCSTDEQAYGVLFACHRLGLTVPDDVAVCGFDGTEHSAFSIPPLTTVQQPVGEIADRAILLAGRAESDAPTSEVLPFDLILRESCGHHQGSSS